jgi:hypothetical protein
MVTVATRVVIASRDTAAMVLEMFDHSDDD